LYLRGPNSEVRCGEGERREGKGKGKRSREIANCSHGKIIQGYNNNVGPVIARIPGHFSVTPVESAPGYED